MKTPHAQLSGEGVARHPAAGARLKEEHRATFAPLLSEDAGSTTARSQTSPHRAPAPREQAASSMRRPTSSPPGFVDIHTHYDGQVCWDKQVTPSSWHGVTSIVMGNCGVGFAPVRPGTEDNLVELMESVEDIPGTALHDGIPWGWESFAEYLDSIDTPYTVDVGTQVPHVAMRHYVMGERCYDDATPEDMAEMRRLTRTGLEAGALGFSTSRFYGHVDEAGNLVPGTRASAEEMTTIASAFTGLGFGTMEFVSDSLNQPAELAWIEHITRTTGLHGDAAHHRRSRAAVGSRGEAARGRLPPAAPGGCAAGIAPDDPRWDDQPHAAVPRLPRDS